jgi:hypothetical protein
MRYAYRLETLEAEDIPIHTLVALPPRVRRPPPIPRAPLPSTVRPPARAGAAASGERPAVKAERPAEERARPQEGAGVHRRASPRRPLSARMTLWSMRESHGGWTLNVSDGGLRVLVEDAVVERGSEMTVEVREDACAWQRKAKVVWVQHEPGGCVAGLQFLQATSILGHAPANDGPDDILKDNGPIYSSKFAVG